MIVLKREQIEKIYRDNCVIVNLELTYHYHTEQEYNDHVKKMREDDFQLELSTDIHTDKPDGLKVAAYYTKHEVISNSGLDTMNKREV